MKLYQGTAEKLFYSVSSFSYTLESLLNSIFFTAAFFEMQLLSDRLESQGRHNLHRLIDAHDKDRVPSYAGDLIDYDSCRPSHGMRIEACNLEFTYPGNETSTLRDINLTIEAGSTIAVVGVNSGGMIDQASNVAI